VRDGNAVIEFTVLVMCLEGRKHTTESLSNYQIPLAENKPGTSRTPVQGTSLLWLSINIFCFTGCFPEDGRELWKHVVSLRNFKLRPWSRLERSKSPEECNSHVRGSPGVVYHLSNYSRSCYIYDKYRPLPQHQPLLHLEFCNNLITHVRSLHGLGP
jgi:hypothetical protein